MAKVPRSVLSRTAERIGDATASVAGANQDAAAVANDIDEFERRLESQKKAKREKSRRKRGKSTAKSVGGPAAESKQEVTSAMRELREIVDREQRDGTAGMLVAKSATAAPRGVTTGRALASDAPPLAAGATAAMRPDVLASAVRDADLSNMRVQALDDELRRFSSLEDLRVSGAEMPLLELGCLPPSIRSVQAYGSGIEEVAWREGDEEEEERGKGMSGGWGGRPASRVTRHTMGTRPGSSAGSSASASPSSCSPRPGASRLGVTTASDGGTRSQI